MPTNVPYDKKTLVFWWYVLALKLSLLVQITVARILESRTKATVIWTTKWNFQ